MYAKSIALSVVVVLLVVSVARVESCSCQFQSADRHYCESDFVVLAIAKNQTRVDDTVTYYDIDLWRIYRSRNGAVDSALITKKLWTATYDSLCGIQLVLGEPYVLSGDVYDSKPRISLCNYHQIWNEITVEEENGFSIEYKKFCDRIVNSNRNRYMDRGWRSSR